MLYNVFMNYTKTIKKLQTAINMQGQKLLYCTSEFYSKDLQRPVIMYYIKNAVFDGDSVNNEVLFKSASQIRVVFFLRDLLEYLNSGIRIDEAQALCIEKQKTYITKREVIRGKEDSIT